MTSTISSFVLPKNELQLVSVFSSVSSKTGQYLKSVNRKGGRAVP